MTCVLLAAMPFAARAQSSVLYSPNFHSVTTPAWNSMGRGALYGAGIAGAYCGVVATTNFPTSSTSAYQIEAYGGNAAGWALCSSPVLAGSTSNWTCQADAKWTRSDNPDIVYHGNGGLLLCSEANVTSSNNWLWIGFIREDYGDGTGNSWARAYMEWNLAGSSGSSVDNGNPAFRDYTNSPPVNLRASRTNGSDTVTLSYTSPLDGDRTFSVTFTGDQLTALGTLQYVGFINYQSTWQYDNLVVTGPQSALYSNNFEPVPFPGWNAMTPGDGANCGAVLSSYFTNSSAAYLVDAFGGGASGWALYSNPVLAGTTSNFSYQASYTFTGTRNPAGPAYYGSGGLLLSSGPNGVSGNNYIWLGSFPLAWTEPENPNHWARPYAQWQLGTNSFSDVLYPPVVDSWGAYREFPWLETIYYPPRLDAPYGPTYLTVGRTNGTATLTYTIDSPVDGRRVCTLNFTGEAAAALDTLHYVGFMNYFSSYEYNNLVVTGVQSSTPPTLGITVSSGVARVTWPATSDPGFVLQSNSDLATANWVNAGTPFVEGGNNVVTNPVTSSPLFYRLKK